MEIITEIIAANLQSIRKERRMTLQDLADLTGVSKSMLGEIERGTSNPTITVLWKIITGLKISISHLIHEQGRTCQMVEEKDWRTLHAKPADISMIFECDHTRNFEVYHLEFQPGASYASDSHDRGMVEYIMVYEGCFTITVNDKHFELAKGDSLLFDADTPHAYVNHSGAVAKCYSLIHYPRSM
ncbi:MAG: XRE family transcriptional regulator [Candidatus Adiutrix sp.]|jgi:transcriptional regulator with XRE-family HTH domain|nr:XRE family transcriptional regulator [Candidatus Adiutrix sp.]